MRAGNQVGRCRVVRERMKLPALLVVLVFATSCSTGHSTTQPAPAVGGPVPVVASQGPGTGVHIRLRLNTSVIYPGDTVAVTVTVTNTSPHDLVVGDCLSIMGVYPAFLDARSRRTLSGPGTLQCDAAARSLPAGRSTTYTAKARAFTGIPPAAHEERLPPGQYLLALRHLNESHTQFGLDRVPALRVTVVP